MVMDDSTKNINISLRAATLCRHFSYVLHELYFIFFIIYLDTQGSKMRFLVEDILACRNTAFLYLQHRWSNTGSYSSTRQLQCCYSKAIIIISQWEIHTSICTNTLTQAKYSVHEVSILVFMDFFITHIRIHTYKHLCCHSCVYRL